MDMMLQPALKTYESQEQAPKAKEETDDDDDWNILGLLLDCRSESSIEGRSAASHLRIPKNRRSHSLRSGRSLHSPENEKLALKKSASNALGRLSNYYEYEL